MAATSGKTIALVPRRMIFFNMILSPSKKSVGELHTHLQHVENFVVEWRAATVDRIDVHPVAADLHEIVRVPADAQRRVAFASAGNGAVVQIHFGIARRQLPRTAAAG